MASSRKKQDEKNIKTIRELGAQPQNKYCFDCNQRGPTYVNMTIGSFVCTKCSGMLRGLTPPHRVKSISMATFTTEEINMLKSRGNDYCKSVWLGLHQGFFEKTECGDEQTIKDFMVDKYERKRFFLDSAQSLKNCYKHPESKKVKSLSSLVSDPKPIKPNENLNEPNKKRLEVGKSVSFDVNFDNADDIFNSNYNNNDAKTLMPQESFANFDDNPVFNINTNTSGLQTPPKFDNFYLAPRDNFNKVPAAPPEDKYAALKDLDNALKQGRGDQNTVDWNSSESNGSLYSYLTSSGSVYSSPSPRSSLFGSPSQGQLMSAFQNPDCTISNPFSKNGISWDSKGNNFASVQPFVNPFREPSRVKGLTQNFQPQLFSVTNSTTWGVNPFKVGATANSNANNPFL